MGHSRLSWNKVSTLNLGLTKEMARHHIWTGRRQGFQWEKCSGNTPAVPTPTSLSKLVL